ncbi:MAG: FkbM family methyltransferase [candidate division KSB1 bacterium]|nr:FkbM family methyltransferase [candidate division KSB1 bacterium]
MQFIQKKIKKLLKIICNKMYLKALLKGVAASVEHESVLKTMNINTIIDIGGNRGQFSLVARNIFPNAKIIAFEPLKKPFNIFRELFLNDEKVQLYQYALGHEEGETVMHVSRRDDSSSLLPISKLQESVFPGTNEEYMCNVMVSRLDSIIDFNIIDSPILLKLDIQGYEYQVLESCVSFIDLFEYIYCELSFVELYSDQVLANKIIDFLSLHNIILVGVYNLSYDNQGLAIQGDFLFKKSCHL